MQRKEGRKGGREGRRKGRREGGRGRGEERHLVLGGKILAFPKYCIYLLQFSNFYLISKTKNKVDASGSYYSTITSS